MAWVSVTDVETVCVCPPLSSAHTHTLPVPVPKCYLKSSQRSLRQASSYPWYLSPAKPEQLFRDLAPHPSLTRSGTQWLLSSSLIPLWFILVLFAFPECSSLCLTVLRSLPSPTLYQWITHPSTGAECRILCVCVCLCVHVLELCCRTFTQNSD